MATLVIQYLHSDSLIFCTYFAKYGRDAKL